MGGALSSKTEAYAQKKTRRSQQAAEESKQRQRLKYWEEIRSIVPENLVFIDETGVLLGAMRMRGRSQRGQRVYDLKPFYRGQKVTVIGAISCRKVLAIKSIQGSMNGENFKQFLAEELVPKLWEGAVVVMDNLSAHKVAGVEEIIEAKGARIVYLSPYSRPF